MRQTSKKTEFGDKILKNKRNLYQNPIMPVMACRIFCNHIGRWSLSEVCINQKMMLCLDGEVPITKPIALDALLSHSPRSEWQQFSILWSMYMHA